MHCIKNNTNIIKRDKSECFIECDKTTTKSKLTTREIPYTTISPNCQEWTEWGSCTRLNKNRCANDKRNRTMICEDAGGEGKKIQFQYKKCQLKCETNITISSNSEDKCSNWSEWSECTGTACKFGMSIRSQICRENRKRNTHYEYKQCQVPCATTEITIKAEQCFNWSKWSECNGIPCKSGKRIRSKYCKNTKNIVNEYKYCEVDCVTTSVANIIATTITAESFVDHVNCSRCDFSHGQGWQPDFKNCHGYFICIRLPGNKKFRIYKVNCGVTYWNQKLSTCTTTPDPDSKCDMKGNPITATTQRTNTIHACMWKAYPADHHYFWTGNNHTLQMCASGTIFSEAICGCIMDTKATAPKCKSDPMLHFPYDDHFNDISCNHAISILYGDKHGAIIQKDGNNKYVCFSGKTHFEVPFMRRWFAGRHIQNFTITLWYKSDTVNSKPSHTGIFHNGDCIEDAGFEFGTKGGKVYIAISTETNSRKESKNIKTTNEWHHMTWRYNGEYLDMYIDGKIGNKVKMSGDMSNTDAPLVIGKMCASCYFTGCIDNLKLYSRGLTYQEILNEYHNRN